MKQLLRLSFILFFVSVGTTVSAATLYIDPTESTLNLGDTATLAVRLNVDDAAGECINAVDGVLSYSNNIELIDTSIGRSIFSMWVEQPTIDKVARTVTFAGGIPNGYCGRVDGDPRLTNVLVELIVRAPSVVSDETSAQVGFMQETTAYVNDGFGTAKRPATYGATLSFTNMPGLEVIDPWQEAIAADITPPAPFSINLQKNNTGKYYIIVNTTDKQTGVDQYQVMEEPMEQFGSFMWGRANAPWITTNHPQHHILKDQSLNSVIYVKALDKAGNEYIATLVPEESLRTLSGSQKLSIVLLGLLLTAFLVIFVLLYVFLIRAKNEKKLLHNDENEN